MFKKRKRKPKAKKTDVLMYYSSSDLFFSSYLTEALDAHAIRCLTYILLATNNTKMSLKATYKEIQKKTEISNNRLVGHALRQLEELEIIKISGPKKDQSIKVLKTAKKIKRTPRVPLFLTKNDFYFNSYLTEKLDPSSIRCLTFVLKHAKDSAQPFPATYMQIRHEADISCNNYVQQSLKKLISAKLIEVSKVKKIQQIRPLFRTARIAG